MILQRITETFWHFQCLGGRPPIFRGGDVTQQFPWGSFPLPPPRIKLSVPMYIQDHTKITLFFKV